MQSSRPSWLFFLVPGLALGILFVLPQPPSPLPSEPDPSSALPVGAREDPPVPTTSVRAPALSPPSPSKPTGPRRAAPGAEPTPRDVALLRGRFLLPGGEPARGAEIEVVEYVATGHASQPDLRRAIHRAEEDGRFAIELECEPVRSAELTVHAPGHAPRGWNFDSLLPRLYDLGDRTLERGATIHVSIRRPDGTVADADWTARAKFEGTRVEASTYRFADYDPELGAWQITDVPAGRIQVKAHSKIAGWLAPAYVHTVAGGRHECVLTYSGPATDRMISVTASVAHVYALVPKEVALIGPAGPVPLERRGGALSFTSRSLDPGDYTVVIDDPRFLRWERHGVRPGERVWAELQGSAAIVVRIRDRATSTSVAECSIAVRREDVGFRPDVFDLPVDAEKAVHRYQLPPGSYALLVDATDYPRSTVPILGLRREEERVVEVDLDRTSSLRGVVVDAESVPLQDALVEAYNTEVDDWWTGWGSELRDRHRVASTRTGPSGEFELPSDPTREQVVRAVQAPGLQTIRRVGPARDAAEDLRLTLPRAAALAGRVKVADGVDPTRFSVRAGASSGVCGLPPEQWTHTFDAFLESGVEADGSFRLAPLPLDLVRVGLIDDGTLLHETHLRLAGDRELDVDLRGSLPVPVEIHVTATGTPAPDLVVQLTRSAGHTFHAVDSPATDLSGRTRARAVPGVHNAFVRHQEGWWRWEFPAPVTVDASGTTILRLDVPATFGEIDVHDERGRPVAHTDVSLLRSTSPNTLVDEYRARTNGAGRVAAWALAGPIWIARSRPMSVDWRPFAVRELGSLPRVDWPLPGSGRVVVALPPTAESR